MYRRLPRPLIRSLLKRHHQNAHVGSRLRQMDMPPVFTSFRLASSTSSMDDKEEEEMKKRKEKIDKKDNEELMDVIERSKDAGEAVDRILTDEKVTDISDREMEELKKKYPDDLSDEQLDKMFEDDLNQDDYLGIDEDGKVSGGEHEQDNEKDEPAPAEEVEEPEPVIPPGEKLSFQAETRQLLDIVTHSLYTDKEVFLRELVSNASDALEKLRHMQATNQVSSTIDTEYPLEIRIDTDEVSSTVTITDTGVGMSKDELISNLGTIARSGSKNFIKQLKEAGSQDDGNGIIGKFGVGFYSSFMVGRKVEVRSRSATDPKKAYVWTSDGSGEFEIAELPESIRQDRGSSLVIHLTDEHWEYASEARIEKILKRYSNFVNYPILLNGKRVNTLRAIWSVDPKTVSKDEYTAFYKYIASAVDEPFETYHFRADAPLDVKALFYIPSFHSEKFGSERMEPGVSLYSRKVLIVNKSKDILPDWMRFVKGVVDSEDLPLSISREKPQDTALIAKLRTTLVRKFIAHLVKMSKKQPDRYLDEFYSEYNIFLKEGACQDKDFQGQLSKLLRFESTRNLDPDADNTGQGQLISLDEYISRMQPEQKNIFYLVAPTRDAALNSPYLEVFENAGVEVLLMFTAIDDFVMANMEKYEGRKLVNVESGDVDVKDLKKKKTDGKDDTKDSAKKDSGRVLSSAESLEFCDWFKGELGEEKVTNCAVSERLTTSPAIVVDNESGGLRRMMRGINPGENEPLEAQSVEINPKHPIITGVFDLRTKEPVLAKTIAAQIYDNCLLAAGLMDDGRSMLPRLNGILESIVKTVAPPEPATSKPTIVDLEESSDTTEDPKFDEDVIEADFVNKTEAAETSDSSSDSSDSDNEQTTEKKPDPKSQEEESKKKK